MLEIDASIDRERAVQILTLRGALDIATSPKLRAMLLDGVAPACQSIIVDLSNVDFVDSTGLGALVAGHKRASEGMGSLRVVIGEGQVARVLSITKLADILATYDSVSAALSPP